MAAMRRGSRIGLAAAALLAAGSAGCRRGGELPPETYAEVVGAFYTGLAALEAGDNDRALVELGRVTELAPGEAAGWANLALSRLRAGDAPGADAALATARDVAPENPDVDWLAGVFASRAGNSDEAIAAWERAVERDPDHLRARFALVEELGRQAAPDADARIAAHLEAVLTARPGNLLALLERARLGARTGDDAALASAVDAIDARRAELPEDARAQLDVLRSTLADGAAGEVALALTSLGNLLLPTAAYQADFAALKSEYGAVGEPLYRFASLPAPSPLPAPADRSLAFETAPIDVRGTAGAVYALLLDPEAEPVAAVETVDGDGGPLLLDDAAGARLEPRGPGLSADRHGVLAVDLDGDGAPEIAMAGAGGLSVHRRGADGAWGDVTSAVIDDDLTAPAYDGLWAVDVELDGDLDLVVSRPAGARGPGSGTPPGPLVLVNGGDGRWTSTSPFAGSPAIDDLAWADLDGDGDPDVALLAEGSVTVFDNARGGTYTAIDGPDLAGVRDVAVADADRDGRLELVAAVVAEDGASVATAERHDGGWDVATLVAADALSAAELGRDDVPNDLRVLAGDLDNNGAVDLVVGGHAGAVPFLADADGALVARDAVPLAPGALVDLEGDGRLEILGVQGGAAVRAASTGEAEYGWQLVRPRAIAAGDQRNNAFGLGGQAEVRAGLLVQKQAIEAGVLHFGLGDRPGAQALRIRWPNGTFQAEFDVAPSTEFVANQRLKGSCPWLFAWDGAEMAFVTDVLWRSPLGLRINAQVTAGVVQTFDRVRIPGDGLALRDGAYDLRITAELWETHFFDLVGLQAVDHPAGTEVHVDERFRIPPPPLEPVVTGPVRPVDSATDDRGRDQTAAVAARDGVHADGVPLGRYQGVTTDHGLEVTILEPPPSLAATGAGDGDGEVVPGTESAAEGEGDGTAPRARGPWLVAHGWVYPTDSSLNVALSQGDHPPPAGLRLEVPDETAPGGWRTHADGLGFPAGKRKTLLIDLADVPRTAEGALRVRLATNLEVYWDALGVAAARAEAARLTPATLASAELAYRGFSYTNKTAPTDAAPARSVPEIPFYDRIASTTPMWLDLRGFHTRFGDVAPLLAAVDDRYAILNAGDELRLRFDPLPPPPAGWVRDYVFESDGWEKDGDLNTAYGATVQPLPSHDRPEYADPTVLGPVGPLSEETAYRKHPDDWRDYHTRYVSPWPAENALRRAGAAGAAGRGGGR